MPRPTRLFTVVVGSVSPGRCRDCGHAIVFALVVTQKGEKKLMPFTKEPIFASEFQAENHVRYQRWPSDLLHFVTCPNARPRTGASFSR
jgi:hypothetical protein